MSQYLGDISAYALAVSQGYTGTEEEYAELMASYATVGQTAVTAAQTATTKASEAATSATTATNKASEATTAATTATTKAGEASTSASTATSAKDTAVSASQTATTKASEATTAAATATSAATTATTAKDDAVSAKTAAQTAQTGAETAAASVQSSAAQIATNAEDISQLKSEITALAPKEDMLKSFPTDTASGSVASFADGANVPVKSLIVNIDPVQSGSGDPSPDNVRPISGWSEVNINACGVNVWDEEYVLNSTINPDTGAVSAGDRNIRSKNYIPVIPNTDYYIKSNIPVIIVGYDANMEYVGVIVYGNPNSVFTTKKNNVNKAIHYIRFGTYGNNYGTTYNHDISINYPATDHDYHPYSGQSINIALGQTVYGGTLDVTTGVLTVDRAIVDMGTLQWNAFASSSGFFTLLYAQISGLVAHNGAKGACSTYKMLVGNYTWTDLGDKQCVLYIGANEPRIGVRDSSYTDVTAFASAVSGQTVAYELAEPFEVTLTAQEVRTLLGQNNIWSDSGDVEVEYRADPTLYIQRLTEPDADMVADANITSGQYFMVGNTLYKATANIASGATISPNVNCTRKSLSEALNELNA